MSSHKDGRHDELPEVQELFELIDALSAKCQPLTGTGFRTVSMKFATQSDFLSSRGAVRTGGRWNPRGLPVIYVSLDLETAYQEGLQNFSHFGFPMTSIKPRVFAGASISLSKVIDLSASRILTKLGFSKKALLDEDWRAIQDNQEESWSQAIGRGCHRTGLEGIIVPSARKRNGRNLVIFPENLRTDSQIEILGKEDLPEQ